MMGGGIKDFQWKEEEQEEPKEPPGPVGSTAEEQAGPGLVSRYKGAGGSTGL